VNTRAFKNPTSSLTFQQVMTMVNGEKKTFIDEPSYLRLRDERDDLQRFKDYVHERLDRMNVPPDPDPEKTATTGCRIGNRLDLVEKRYVHDLTADADSLCYRIGIHVALVQIFGAEPEQLVLTSPDHLDITANFRRLCIEAGGKWAKLVEDLDARVAERKTYKDPGADVRLKEEPKP
jgi:hypothetical protein